MSYSQKPCVCGGTTFHLLPNVPMFYRDPLGRTLSTQAGRTWTVTIVVCTQCTRTETFTSNADEIAAHVPGARMIAAGQQ